ncbi:MAG: acyl-CoA thioesterase [Cyclobacteriaceae bacterium]|nr:acyl-CoA thioesterase [Cyclobacteriaceae bacterium]
MEDIVKSITASETTITELMIPSYANFGGKIHGGILLAMMDKVAYACAAKHTGCYCVTVSVDNVDFLAPVEVGELVSLKARVNYVGRTSLVVGIKVIAENVKDGLVKHTNTCYFTMVAKDDNNKPTLVPRLKLESEIDVKRFLEAKVRKQHKNYFKKEMHHVKTHFSLPDEINKLEDERCVVDIEESSWKKQ